ncbi:MAG: restriction endonuclease [Pyrobaculum sp.]
MCDDVKSEVVKFLSGDNSALDCLVVLGFLKAGEPRGKGYVLFKALKKGLKLSPYLRNLEWYEFEEFLKHVFSEYGYEVVTNLRYNCNGGVEFDLVAWSREYALVIEAKRWKMGGVKWREVASRHREKVEKCVEKLHAFAPSVIPLVVTSTETSFISDGVPVISVFKIGSFLSSLDYFIDQVLVFR